MEETIARYRERDESSRPGVTEKDLQVLEGKIDCVLPEEVATLYRDHDGAEADTDLPFRFMPAAEVITWYDMMVEYYRATPDLNCLKHGVRASWTDDNSNYACVYVAGPLSGRVCFLDHEETLKLEPRFRSVRSFLERCMSTSAEDWYEMETDTPEMHRDEDRAASEQDWKMAQSLESVFDATPHDDELHLHFEREYLAACIMVLTPFARSDSLLRFTEDADVNVRIQAMEILGDRKWEAAIPRLTRAVRDGEPGEQLVAIVALGKIGSPAALEALVSLAPTISRSLDHYFDYALHRCGAHVRKENGRRYFRLPGSDQWSLIGPL